MNAGGVDEACKSNAAPFSLGLLLLLRMNYVYLIQSLHDNRYYIGYSADLKQRIQEHNSGKARYTKKFRPWKLLYYEAYASKKLARDREQKLKQHGKRYTELLKRVTVFDED